MKMRWMGGALVALGLMVPVANAQFWQGESEISHQYYDIKFGNTVTGQVLIVGHGSTGHPSGFSAGTEYWWWDTSVGPAWRGGFRLVPVSSGYSYSAKTWETYDLDHFDLSTSEPMPDVNLDPQDRFYEVIEIDQSTNPATQTTVAYMWLDGGAGGEQIWFGIDGTLANDLVGVGMDAIRLSEMDTPPAEDSIDINPLCDGTCP